MSASDVYRTARGPLPRVVEPLAKRARARRHARFVALFEPSPGWRIIDVGCGAIGLRGFAPELDITGVDLAAPPAYPGPFVHADASVGLPFADGEFDLAYCSSVIEHVPRERRTAFAAEVRRVARGWYVQTPARSFPIEPHSLLPGAQWLPRWLRRRYWRLGASGVWEDLELLTRAELEALFGRAEAERFGPFAKSWVVAAVPPPRPAAACGGSSHG